MQCSECSELVNSWAAEISLCGKNFCKNLREKEEIGGAVAGPVSEDSPAGVAGC